MMMIKQWILKRKVSLVEAALLIYYTFITKLLKSIEGQINDSVAGQAG